MQHNTRRNLYIAILAISLSGCANAPSNLDVEHRAVSEVSTSEAIETPSARGYSPIKESVKQMNGARTILLQYNVYADDTCKVDSRQLHAPLENLIDDYGRLKRVGITALPDLVATVNVEASRVPDANQITVACMYTINIRAIHPLLGKLGYGKDPLLIQALTFNKSAYSLIVPDKINDAVQIQSVKLLNMLIADHRTGSLNQ